MKKSLFSLILLVIVLILVWMLGISCFNNQLYNKFDDPTIEKIKLERGERLQDVYVYNGVVYIRTTVENSPAKTHYIQNYVNKSFKVKLIIQEQ